MKTPMWIGIEIPDINGTLKVCIGIDQEDGNEISFCNQADIELAKLEGGNPWMYQGKLKVVRGTEGAVFDDEHNLIK